MACRHAVDAQFERLLQEESELHLLVAEDTGIGGSPSPIFLTEIIDDLLLERLPKMKDIKRNSNLQRYPSCILDIGKTAAARCTFAVPVRRPDAHGGPNHVIALLFQKAGSDARVNPSAHCDNHPFSRHITSLPTGDCVTT